MNLFEKLFKKVFIVAEIGNNHNGDITTAKRLIDIAVESGVDAVKFQTFRGLDIVTPKVLSSEYSNEFSTNYTYWYEFLDSIALPLDKHKEIFDYANSKGIIAFSTPTSLEIVDFLENLNVPLYKVASMDVTNMPLLKKIASTGKPVILSTGMAEEKEIESAVRCFDIKKIILLHCISEYPLSYESANLKAILKLKDKFSCPIGFSDHSLGYELSIIAVAYGARVIEKHITLDRKPLRIAEHHFALEPSELKVFVTKIRQSELALGKETIKRTFKERKIRTNSRRSLHVNKEIKIGEILKSDDISILRPADGASPQDIDYFIGKSLRRHKEAWAPLKKEDV